MGAKPKIQFTVWLQSNGNGPSRTYVVLEHNGDELLRTFTAVVYADSSDESRVADWCEINQDDLPANGGLLVIEATHSGKSSDR
jgi:hypothetical protein